LRRVLLLHEIKASAIGREGLGDSFELQIRYMLAKFVFVALKYKGWVGLDAHALHEKAEPYKFAVRELWSRLKRSDKDLMSPLKPFVKHKWCDVAYFLSQASVLRTCRVRQHAYAASCADCVAACVAWQDHCMKLHDEGKLHPLEFVTRMAVMAFVYARRARAAVRRPRIGSIALR
jgi:hypothetical protein